MEGVGVRKGEGGAGVRGVSGDKGDKGSKLSRKSARIAKVAELSATFSEITIRSYQADPFALCDPLRERGRSESDSAWMVRHFEIRDLPGAGIRFAKTSFLPVTAD